MYKSLAIQIMLVLMGLGFQGCDYVEPGNPYDPDTVYDQRAVGFVSGTIAVPKGDTAFSLANVVLTLTPLEIDVPAFRLTASENGSFNFSLVPAGYLELDAQAEVDGKLYGLPQTYIFELAPNEKKFMGSITLLDLTAQ
jgi:hypothetical protein